MEGTCKPREIQTALSFLVAAVSITTDWIFAILPFALLWKIQMSNRIKASVIGLLGLGFLCVPLEYCSSTSHANMQTFVLLTTA